MIGQFTKREAFITALTLLITFTSHVVYAPFFGIDIERTQLLLGVEKFLETGQLPQHGMLNSQRLYNPPHHVWLYLIPYSFLRSPAALLIPTILINVAAIFSLIAIAKRYLTFEIGVMMALLYQVLPLGQYIGGTTAWAQALIPGLFVCFLYCLLRWFIDNHQWFAIPTLLIATTAVGIHLATIIWIPIILGLMIWYVRQLNWLIIGIAGILIFLMWLPFIEFQLERDFVDVRGLVDSSVQPVIQPYGSEICPVETPASRNIDASDIQSRDLITRLKLFVVGTYRRVRNVFLGILQGVTTNLSATAWGQAGFYKYQSNILYILGWSSLVYGLYHSYRGDKFIRWITLLLIALIILQNLSPFGTFLRPDISWMYYSLQIILIISFLTHKAWFKLPAVRLTLWLLIVSQVVIAYIQPPLDPFKPFDYARDIMNGRIHSQRQIVDWIVAQDTGEDNQIIIQYDFAYDNRDLCWMADYGTLDENYYIGVEFDYWLQRVGYENPSPSLDGLAEDPDFIILVREHKARYEPIDTPTLPISSLLIIDVKD